jgi:hypothetical protein
MMAKLSVSLAWLAIAVIGNSKTPRIKKLAARTGASLIADPDSSVKIGQFRVEV